MLDNPFGTFTLNSRSIIREILESMFKLQKNTRHDPGLTYRYTLVATHFAVTLITFLYKLTDLISHFQNSFSRECRLFDCEYFKRLLNFWAFLCHLGYKCHKHLNHRADTMHAYRIF